MQIPNVHVSMLLDRMLADKKDWLHKNNSGKIHWLHDNTSAYRIKRLFFVLWCLFFVSSRVVFLCFVTGHSCVFLLNGNYPEFEFSQN